MNCVVLSGINAPRCGGPRSPQDRVTESVCDWVYVGEHLPRVKRHMLASPDPAAHYETLAFVADVAAAYEAAHVAALAALRGLVAGAAAAAAEGAAAGGGGGLDGGVAVCVAPRAACAGMCMCV